MRDAASPRHPVDWRLFGGSVLVLGDVGIDRGDIQMDSRV
jgi:hypothetical protein